MTALVGIVIASVLAGDGTAIALDDGTVWMIHDGAADPLGACDDGEVIALSVDDDEVLIACGDGTRWSWSDGDGWQEIAIDVIGDETGNARSGWPALDLVVDEKDRTWAGWIRLRWDY